jgi:lambda family phage portal protein
MVNLIDKAVEVFAPQTALKRVRARKHLKFINSFDGNGYGKHGASHARKSLIGWLASGSDADSDIVDNIETLRARSRDLFMGAPLATGALKTVRTNTIGSGLALNAQIDAKFLGLTEEQAREWEANTEREWRLWAESVDCDAERRQTFYQLQSLVLLSAIMSGDVFVTMPIIKRAGCPYDLRIGLIEADRVCNPTSLPKLTDGKNIHGGVEIGKYGEAVAYWVAKHNPNSVPRLLTPSVNEWKRVLAFGASTGRRNVLHIMSDVERPAQRRGVPMLAPVIESLKQLSRYSDAELMAAVISGMFTVFIESDNPQSPLGNMFDPNQQVDKDPNAYELGNGAIVGLEPGEKINVANPGRPNTAFDGFISSMCKQIGTALEIPHELLLKQFTSSYSASRGALLEAWKMFRMRREWIIGNFCDPIYKEWLTEAVLKGRIKAQGFFDDPAIQAAWCGAEWHGDCQGQLDPVKEATAAKIRVEEGFSTREREAAELTGMKYDEICAKRKREEELRKEWAQPSQAAALPIEDDSNDENDGDEDDEI